MRICYLLRPGLGMIKGSKDIGGTQVLCLQEARELAKDKRFDIHLIVEGKKEERFKKGRITIWVIKKTPKLLELLQAYRLFKRIDADIYCGRFTSRAQMLYEPLLCHLLGKKYVLFEASDPRGILKRPIWGRTAYRIGLWLADSVVANAVHIKRGLKLFTKRSIDQINIYVSPPHDATLKREHILWVGRHIPTKRPELFLDLAREFPNERFIMVAAGGTPPKRSVPQNVTVLRDVPNNELGKYYAAAKLVVHTSVSEGFSLVFVESWTNRTPVVSLTVNPDDVLTKYDAGLHSKTFNQMVKDVESLLSDERLWTKCSENGYRYMQEHHNKNAVIEKYKELFVKLAKI